MLKTNIEEFLQQTRENFKELSIDRKRMILIAIIDGEIGFLESDIENYNGQIESWKNYQKEIKQSTDHNYLNEWTYNFEIESALDSYI